MKNSIPVCYFPTKILMIDDDQAFAQSILFKLHKDKFHLIHSPQVALQFLNTQYQSSFHEKNLLIDNTSDPQINIKKLVSLTHENWLQNEFSLLIVDYHMPEMTGLELLAQIDQPQMKKILMTSETDYKIAVNAFNQGLIHAYVRKDEPDFIEQLSTIIKKLKWQYFVDITSPLFAIADDTLNYLQDELLVKQFNSYLKDHDIQTFYMINPEGDFLLLDKEGSKSYFIVRTQDQLNELASSAKEDGASQEVIEQLAQGKVIPFFGEEKRFWEVPAGEWGHYLLPVKNSIREFKASWLNVEKQEKLL